MIKPESLWGLFKTCTDSKWLGDICRFLGRQPVELDFGQQQMVNTIQQDSGWMDERHEAKLEKDRERKRKSRGIRVTPRNPQCHSDKTDSTDSAPYLPTDLPTYHTSSDEDVVEAAADFHLPSDADQAIFADQVGVPRSYIPTFNARIAEIGYQYISKGQTVNITRSNWKTVLRKFYKVDQQSQADDAPSSATANEIADRLLRGESV